MERLTAPTTEHTTPVKEEEDDGDSAPVKIHPTDMMTWNPIAAIRYGLSTSPPQLTPRILVVVDKRRFSPRRCSFYKMVQKWSFYCCEEGFLPNGQNGL